VFCALHDQLASLGRHAQLTRCFSAVAELLVLLHQMFNMSTLPLEDALKPAAPLTNGAINETHFTR